MHQRLDMIAIVFRFAIVVPRQEERSQLEGGGGENKCTMLSIETPRKGNGHGDATMRHEAKLKFILKQPMWARGLTTSSTHDPRTIMRTSSAPAQDTHTHTHTHGTDYRQHRRQTHTHKPMTHTGHTQHTRTRTTDNTANADDRQTTHRTHRRHRDDTQDTQTHTHTHTHGEDTHTHTHTDSTDTHTHTQDTRTQTTDDTDNMDDTQAIHKAHIHTRKDTHTHTPHTTNNTLHTRPR